MNTKVTVIIPAFNEELTIQRCVDSLLNQTIVPNIVVVNDGSSDNTREKLYKYKHLDNFLLVNQINQGVSVARNRGIKTANTEFVTFVDADDYVENNFIQTLLEGYQQSKNIDLSICNYSIKKQNSETVIYGKFNTEVVDKLKYFDSVLSNDGVNGFVYNKMFRKSIIVKHNIWFDPQIAIGEDFLFCILYGSCCNQIALNNLVQIHYLPTSSGISDTMTIKGRFSAKIFEYFDANLKILKYLNSLKPRTELKDLINREICRISIIATIIIRKVYLYRSQAYFNRIKPLRQFLKDNLLITIKSKEISNHDKIIILMTLYFPKLLTQLYKKKVNWRSK